MVFLSFVAAVSGFCFGYDTGVISASLVSIKDDFGHILSNVEKEWISSATSIGALLGYVTRGTLKTRLTFSALSSGALADRIGRKWVLAYGDVWFTLGAIVICSSFSVAQMIIGRFILGVGT